MKVAVVTRKNSQDIQGINRYRMTWLTQRQKFFIRKYIIHNLFVLASAVTYVIRPVLPAAWLRVDRPIFIVGCSRSGTTVFVDMFADHPEIANWSEAAQLFELRFCDPEIDHVKTEAHATAFTARRLQVMIGLFTRLRKRQRFLNKHPENSLRIRLLKKIFPDARFIHLIRDGRAVVFSNYAQTLRDPHRMLFPFGWFPKPPGWRNHRDLPWLDQFAHQWVGVVENIRECLADVVPERDRVEIRYEDFCDAPRETLRRLDEFCGFDNDLRQTAVTGKLEASNGKWRTDIPPEDMARIAPIISPLLAELGYEDAASEKIKQVSSETVGRPSKVA
jgi:hypothetical protein